MTVDPTSELAEHVSEDTAPRCGVCDDPAGYDPAHRVVTWIESGTVHTEHFCSPACRATYLQTE